MEYKVGEGKGYVRMSSAEEAKAAVAGLTESKKTIGAGSDIPITVTVIEGLNELPTRVRWFIKIIHPCTCLPLGEEEKGYWQKIWEGKTSGRGRRGPRSGRRWQGRARSQGSWQRQQETKEGLKKTN